VQVIVEEVLLSPKMVTPDERVNEPPDTVKLVFIVISDEPAAKVPEFWE
jgi:hypothetical protein